MPGGEPTALCRGASRQRYAGGRADSVMPSVMPRQRYAFPALCLATTGGCLPKITTCPRNRSSGGFYNYGCFFIKIQEKIENGGPQKSQESIVIYLSKPTSWQKYEIILWPIALMCPWHFIKNVQEKLVFWATPVFLFYKKIASPNCKKSM